MANFGSYFLKGFQPTFTENFNTSFKYGLNQQEEEKKRQELLKQQQDQQSILNQLIGGQKTNASYRGMYSPLQVETTPLTNEEKFGLYSQLNPTNQNAYEYWQKQNRVEKKPYTNINYGEQIQAFDPNTNTIVNLGENKNFKEKQQSVWVGDEKLGDKIRALKGYEDPNADTKDPNVRVINGKKYRITDYVTHDIYEKKSNDGQNYYDISKETKKAFNDYYKRQQELRAITNAGFGNAASKKTDSEGNPITFAQELDRHNKIYLSAVQNTMRPEAKDWYDQLYNGANGNLAPEDYLLNLKNSFTKGELGNDPNKSDNYDVADFNTLLEQFKAIYGFDPKEKYGQFLEDIK